MGKDYRISQLGTIGTGGGSISFGQIVLSLKELSGKRQNTITGSLQRYGSNLSLVAALKGSDYDSKGIKSWEVERTFNENSSLESLIPAMIEDLAFQIAHDIIKGEGKKQSDVPQTWQAFKYLLLAKEAFYSYNATENINYLSEASNMVLAASSSEPHYPGSIGLQSDLSVAYGNALASLGRYRESIDAYDEAIRLNPQSAEAWYNKGIALASLGRYKKSIDAYDEAIKLGLEQQKAV